MSIYVGTLKILHPYKSPIESSVQVYCRNPEFLGCQCYPTLPLRLIYNYHFRIICTAHGDFYLAPINLAILPSENFLLKNAE